MSALDRELKLIPAPCLCCADYGAYMLEHNIPVCVICANDGSSGEPCSSCAWGSNFQPGTILAEKLSNKPGTP